MNRRPDKSDGQDWLDKMLAGDNDYIHDAGFTESVMRRLPAPRQAAPRALILGCAALLAVAALLLTAPDAAFWYGWYDRFVAFLYAQPVLKLFAMALATYAVMSAIAWWVIDPDS